MSPAAEPSPEGVKVLDQPPRKPAISLQSLRVQMAVGSAVVTLMAVTLVTVIALITFVVSFHLYQRSQLAAEATRIATTIGQGRGLTAANQPQDPTNLLSPFAQRGAGSLDVWIMDTAGNVIVGGRPGAPKATTLSQDAGVITSALARGVRGQSTDGLLHGSSALGLTQRIYAAAPIHLGGTTGGKIIGAVALSTPLRQDAATLFAVDVSRIIFVLALAVAGVAAAAAALFSRRFTRPIERLAAATARMAGGDYSTRVAISAPDELRTLAGSFNEMATVLQNDINELHRQEQLRRELIANVSHDLATPLTAIQGFTEALQDEVIRDPAERAETMRLIGREAARLRRLVDQLRQVALFEGDALALDRTAVHLPTLVTETLAVLAPEVERKQVVLTNEVPSDLPAVSADADRLTEILLNLFDNALRHTPVGGRIDVSGARVGKLVQITIADSGPGIAESERERIFERFYRLDPSRNAATGGSGLGLAIVRALVEAHGGTILVDARPGGGARFAFTLPIQP